MAQEITQQLAQFAAALRYDDLPQSVRDHCKTLLLDTLACAVAGRLGEETAQVAALASGLAQSAESSVIGGAHLSLAGATLFNGYLVTAATMCDVHRATLTHVTPEVMPPALMIAERDDLSGRSLLTAIAAGCEVTTRIGLGLDFPKFRARGWHGPGIIGPFGAAAAVGSLLDFDAGTMAQAFGLAGSQAAGTFAAWGTPTVKFHQCRGALSGLMAALLAQQKFVATREFLTAKDGGLYNAYVDGGRPDLAVTPTSARAWELEQIAMRLWPSATGYPGFDHGAVRRSRQASDRDRIGSQGSCRLERTGVQDARRLRHLQSQNSKPCCRPTTPRPSFCRRSRAHLGAIRTGPLRRSEAAAVCGRTGRSPCRSTSLSGSRRPWSTSRTTGGASLYAARCEHPLGSFDNPLSRGQIEQKFRTYGKGVLTDADIAGGNRRDRPA